VQPQPAIVPVHGTAVFSVEINPDAAPYSIVWHHDSPTEPSHIIPDGLGFDVHQLTMSVPDCQNDWSYEGDYWISITNDLGGVSSSRVHMTVIAPPIITANSADQTLASGASLNLSVTANTDSAPSVSYQWLKSSVPIAGATAQTFSIGAVTAADTGDYQCDVITMGGRARSNFIRVIVSP